MDPAKVVAVLDWEPPKTKTEIHSFSGLAGYYWKLIQDICGLHKYIIGRVTRRFDADSESSNKYLTAIECT